jgi:hypothetical protein
MRFQGDDDAKLFVAREVSAKTILDRLADQEFGGRFTVGAESRFPCRLIGLTPHLGSAP